MPDHLKPCDPCPWTQPGTPHITKELRALAREGTWFCCHGRGGGTCIGAQAEHKRALAESRSVAAGGCYCDLHPLDCESAGHPAWIEKESV